MPVTTDANSTGFRHSEKWISFGDRLLPEDTDPNGGLRGKNISDRTRSVLIASKEESRELLQSLTTSFHTKAMPVCSGIGATGRRCAKNAMTDMRHTWASHMLAAGADLPYVSEQLGHANPSVTLRIYSHWVPGMRRVTTAVLDREKNASNLQAQAVGKELGGSESL
jgi:integrase